MATVIIPAEVAAEIRRLPLGIQARMERLVTRLASWPQVSGVKHLTGNLAGKCRLRTGDYRLQFAVSAKTRTVKETKVVAGKEVVEEKQVREYTVMIEKAGHRDGFYEE
jgi:mRNA-degrading endonuclease RelE of RelBE toxin-antitoxin system